MSRPTWAYVLASAAALAGMAWRMGWIGEVGLGIAAVVLAVIAGLGLLLGMIVAVTWVFISVVSLICRRAKPAPGPRDAPAQPPR